MHLLFRHGEAGVLDVGRIGHEHEHIFVFEGAVVFSFFGFGRHAVDVVEFQVAGVDDGAPRRLDDEAHGIGDGVGHAEKAHLQFADSDSLVLFDDASCPAAADGGILPGAS